MYDVGIKRIVLTGSNVSQAPGQPIPAQAVLVGGSDLTNIQPLTVSAGGSSDGNSQSVKTLWTVSELLSFNGATWDRWRGNTEGTLLARAVRNATTFAPTQTNYNARGVILTLKVFTAPGNTETLSVSMRQLVPGTVDNSFGLNFSTTVSGTVTTPAIYRFYWYPGAVETINNPNYEAVALPLGRTWTASVNHSGTSNWEYDLTYQYVL